MKYKRISADCHLDLCWLPPDLFVSEASAALKPRMPHVVDSPQGRVWVAEGGVNFGIANGMGVFGRKFVEGAHHRFDVMAETGIYADGERGISRAGDPHLRRKEMERDGVDAEVIYGIFGAASVMKDEEARDEALRIYNTWLKDFCAHYPGRSIGLACLPNSSVAAAVAEVQRAAKLGLGGVEMLCHWDTQPMWHPMWEPLWQALNEVGLPLHFHAFPAFSMEQLALDGPRRMSANLTASALFQINLSRIAAALICGGVLERHPNIRVAFGESGVGWIPYFLERMDLVFDEDARYRATLPMKPSEYWQRQCRASFQYERIGTRLIDDVGAETIMWGSDFPHGDGVWPESGEYIAKQFGHLPPEQVRLITCDNAVKFYALGE